MSIQRFKECRTCGKTEPRRWTEADLYQCESCQADTRAAWREMLRQQSRAQKSAQSKPDQRSVAMARQMAHDPRPADRGTQQDPISDPMHILNPLNPISPVSPLNPLNDWDSSSHRQYEARSVSSVCDDSSRHTSHSSGYESSSSDYSSSYDSGSDSSSYSSGGCD